MRGIYFIPIWPGRLFSPSWSRQFASVKMAETRTGSALRLRRCKIGPYGPFRADRRYLLQEAWLKAEKNARQAISAGENFLCWCTNKRNAHKMYWVQLKTLLGGCLLYTSLNNDLIDGDILFLRKLCNPFQQTFGDENGAVDFFRLFNLKHEHHLSRL